MKTNKDYIEEKTTIYLTSSYVHSLDITIIVETIWKNNIEYKTEIKGFYYGKPNKDLTETYKDKGVILYYE